MKLKTKAAFRRSIWEFDEKYAAPPNCSWTGDLKLISKLQSIEAAKKRIPPAPMARLADIAARLAKPPRPTTVTAPQFAEFLQGLLVYGVGIKTAICMLAVMSDGKYPPMDEQVAAGLRSLRIISAEQEKVLNSANVHRFSEIYVRTVLPRWRAALAKGVTSQDVDARWASAA